MTKGADYVVFSLMPCLGALLLISFGFTGEEFTRDFPSCIIIEIRQTSLFVVEIS